MKFHIGDKVKVVNSGSLYSTNDSKAKQFRLKNWKYGGSIDEGVVGKVVAIDGNIIGISTINGDFVIGEGGLELISSNHKPKAPTHLVVWEEDADPCRFFQSEQEAKDFIKELSEDSDVIKDSIILVEIKSARKVQIQKSLRYAQHKI